MESLIRLHPKGEVKQKIGNHESNHFNTNSNFSFGLHPGS